MTAAVAVRPAPAAPGQIERIDVQGLSRMDLKSFLYLVGVKVGDAYDEQRLRERFKALWEGERERLFEDITIEAEDGPEGGRVVIVKVRERPILSAITYEENK